MKTAAFGLALATGVALAGCAADDGLEETASATQDLDDGSTAPVPDHLAITRVSVLQGVEVPIVQDGRWVTARNAPIVAGRPALVRVYVTPTAGFVPRDVTAELRVATGGEAQPKLTSVRTVTAASTDADTQSTFNFQLPAEAIGTDSTFSVVLTAPDGHFVLGDSDARFPRDGAARALEVRPSAKLKIVLVPLRYDADGSGRLPDLSEDQIAIHRRTLLTRYPVSDVELSVHPPVGWPSVIGANGAGWNNVLRAIASLRQREGAAPDVYYYGLFAPAETHRAYCAAGGGSCVQGLSALVDDPATAFLRASVGLGFPGPSSANTMAHEVGHAHGRRHAPCGGPQGVDESYPYSGARIGVWGYDILSRSLIDPQRGRDMMSYCGNRWVSDYTYAGLYARIAAINLALPPPGRVFDVIDLAATRAPRTARGAARTFRVATADVDGELTWDDDELTLDDEPAGGEDAEATYAAGGGAVAVARAKVYPFDHLPGGFVLVPTDVATTVAGRAAAWSTVTVSGFKNALRR